MITVLTVILLSNSWTIFSGRNMVNCGFVTGCRNTEN